MEFNALESIDKQARLTCLMDNLSLLGSCIVARNGEVALRCRNMPEFQLLYEHDRWNLCC